MTEQIKKTGYSIKRNPVMFIGAALVVLIVLTAVFGPFFCRHDYTKVDYALKCIKPCHEYLFGTDSSGRCLLCRIINGAHISVGVGVSVVFISAAVGIVIGIISGYVGGRTDFIIMRLVEIILSFPGTIFALAVLGTIGNGIYNQIIALSLVRWAHYARFVRTETIGIMNSEYIEAARALGSSRLHIAVKYVIPNIVSRVLVMISISIGPAILSGAALSYLGLGAQIPSPEWGLLVSGGKEFIRTAPWITLFPGIVTAFTALAFNLLGEGIGDMLDPRLKERVVSD
jgi:peptide/nickel transport system permease protein